MLNFGACARLEGYLGKGTRIRSIRIFPLSTLIVFPVASLFNKGRTQDAFRQKTHSAVSFSTHQNREQHLNLDVRPNTSCTLKGTGPAFQIQPHRILGDDEALHALTHSPWHIFFPVSDGLEFRHSPTLYATLAII